MLFYCGVKAAKKERQVKKMDNPYMTVDEVAAFIGKSRQTAYRLMREVNKPLQEKGIITIKGASSPPTSVQTIGVEAMNVLELLITVGFYLYLCHLIVEALLGG